MPVTQVTTDHVVEEKAEKVNSVWNTTVELLMAHQICPALLHMSWTGNNTDSGVRQMDMVKADCLTVAGMVKQVVVVALSI